MDPSSISAVPTPATTAVPFTTEPNNNHPPLPPSAPPPTHPPYAEMIYTAIEALKEKDGSSKRAIGKYIEQVYKEHLPSTHSTLLTHHLKRLKSCGLLQMVKKSYLLPRSAPENANVVAAAQISTPPASRPRGRPRKIQTQAQPQAQNQNIEAQPQAQNNNNNVWAALGLADEPVVVQAVPLEVSKRRPGRPRRSVGAVPAPATATAASQVGSAPSVTTSARRGRPPGSRNVRKPGRPPKAVPSPAAAATAAVAASGLPKRRPGRPPKNQQSQPTPIPFAAPDPAAASETVAPVEIPGGDGEVTRSRRGRGRPRRNAVPAVAAPVAAVSSGRGRGRGRGSRGGGRGSGAGRGRGRGRGGLSAQPGRPGRRPGRPRKGTTSASAPPNAVNEDLKRKLDHFQAKVKESLAVLKPHFNHESSVTAIAAIQELEVLGTMDLNAPLKDEAVPPPQQPEPQQPQPLVQQQYPLPPQQQVVYQQQYSELHQYHQQLQQYPQQQPPQQQQQFHP